MINKIVSSMDDAIASVTSGTSIAVGGFGTAGVPESLIARICERDITDLHIIANNGGTFDDMTAGVGRLIIERRVRKITC